MLCNQRATPFSALLSASALVTLVQRTRFELARAKGGTCQGLTLSSTIRFQGWRVYRFRHLCVAVSRSVTGGQSGKIVLPLPLDLRPLLRPCLSHRYPRLSNPLPQNISIARFNGTICLRHRHSFHALAEDAPGRCAGTATAPSLLCNWRLIGRRKKQSPRQPASKCQIAFNTLDFPRFWRKRP